MKWLKQIFETYNKGLEYDSLLKRKENIQYLYSDLDRRYDKCLELGEELQNKYDLLKEEMTKLLNKDKINVQDLKEWYENKYDDTSWLYNIHDEGRTDAKYALKVTTKGVKILRELASKLISKYHMTNKTSPTKVVENTMKYFLLRGQWTYITDGELYGKKDFWQLAEISAETRKGDCDDLAILMHNLIYYIFDALSLKEHYWRLKLTAAITLIEGHAFNIWLADDGHWYAVESTIDLRGTLKKTWLRTPIQYNNLYAHFMGFARKDKSWVGTQDALENYKEEN